MAAGLLILPGAQPSRSRNGGATIAELRFYENNTTTPKTVYADSGLTTPLSFPVVSDDAGRFVLIWADVGPEEAPNLFTVNWATQDGQVETWDDIQPSAAIVPTPTPGPDGWSPLLAVVVDGERRVFQIADWEGGTGTKPATGDYLGPDGLVTDIALATDVRGPAGTGNISSTGTISANDISVFVDANTITAGTPSTMRGTLGLGTIATQNADAVAITGGSVTGVTDITVSDGGTGVSTLSAGGVVIGNGTSPVATANPGTSGYILTSNGAGVAPSFQAPASSGSLILLSVLTASSSATLDNTANITSAYDAYLIEFENIVPTTANAKLQMAVTSDGGSSWNTMAAMAGLLMYLDSTPSFQTIGTVTNAGRGITGSGVFANPNSTTSYKRIAGSAWNSTASGPGGGMYLLGNEYTGSTSAVNGVRWFFDSGSISTGKIRIYGMKTT